MDEFEKEVKLDFLVEAKQLLNDTEQAFLLLEKERTNSDLINQIFRLAHNLKGTSRAVGFGEVAEFTHEMENLILQVKENKIKITDEVVTLLLECNDHVTNMINQLSNNLESHFDSKEIIKKIKVLNSESTIAIESNEINVTAISNEDLEILKNFNNEISEANPAEENSPAIHIIQKKESKKTSNEDENIRVSLAKVEELNNVVGELAIIQTVLNQMKDSNIGPLMQKSLSQLEKLSKEIQSISMSLRMIPLKQTFSKMQRIVRDTSKSLNKKVELQIIGDETEIDKTVLEHLSDPLVHIIRNAVDHGLECSDDRILSGKNEVGTIVLKAYHEGNNLVIEISDDGNGIDAQKIKSKAIEKNIISKDSNLSESELIHLIFHPGFSTKTEVSEISGRGVGMDVVKTNIEKLSGTVKINTEVKKGSTFKVVLPLTLAIIEAMVTQLNNERYIIPLSQIQETLSPTTELVQFVNGIGHCLKLRGEVIPLFKISKVLNRKDSDKEIEKQIAMIVKYEGQKFGVLVDDIHHQQQVVIKKLGAEIINQKGFMGSSILGDGKPAFILDLIELFSSQMTKKNPINLLTNAA